MVLPVCAGILCLEPGLTCWLIAQTGFVSCRVEAQGEGQGVVAKLYSLAPLSALS